MFYGSFFLNTKIEKSKPFSVFFLQPEIIHRQIQSKKFQGGIFLHPSIPRKLEDLLYTDKNADLIVIFCGTIYSFSNPVYQKFISSNIPNPELIACLFKKFGVQFFNSIIGDFAIAIIKPEKNELYLLRDHLGIYPLVYKSKNGIISFSTDPIGFCRTDLKESEKINLDPLLTHRKIIDTTQTYSKEVHKVLPGHYYYFNKNVFKKIKYWYPEKIKKDPSLTYYDSLNKLEILLSDAIKIRCDNRYYAGSHLSGGLDSSAIAALTRKYYSNQKCVSGFSYSPEITYKKDFIFDERDFVKEICEKNQITPVFSNLTFSDYKSKFKSYIYNLGNFW